MRIVVAGLEEVEDLVRLNGRLFVEDAGVRDTQADISWPARHGREHFTGLLSRGDAVCLVARSDGEALGYLAGYVRGATALRPVRVAELQSMYVVERARGRGLGGRLAEEFFGWARNHGVGRVSVTAYAANGGALRLYRRLGFGERSVTLEREL